MMAPPEQRALSVRESLARIEDLEAQLRARRGLRGWLRRLLTPTVAVSLVLALTGVAYADLPDSGVIQGCYTNAALSGQRALTLIDTSVGGKCLAAQTAIHWNQAGPAGAQGPQ